MRYHLSYAIYNHIGSCMSSKLSLLKCCVSSLREPVRIGHQTHRHSREGGNPSPESNFYSTLCYKPNGQVMDSRMRGNDDAHFFNKAVVDCSLSVLPPHLTNTHNPSPPKTHLLRCSPYIYVVFVNLTQFSRRFTLAVFGVSRHRLNHV
jgi:hypothetical protein